MAPVLLSSDIFIMESLRETLVGVTEDEGNFDDDSDSAALLVALLSGIGSVVIVTCIIIIVYFRLVRTGRIKLTNAFPGIYDDEQQLLEEEENTLAQMDDNDRELYERAKSKLTKIFTTNNIAFAHLVFFYFFFYFFSESTSLINTNKLVSRFSKAVSTGKCQDRNNIVSVSFNSGKGGLSMGICTRP